MLYEAVRLKSENIEEVETCIQNGDLKIAPGKEELFKAATISQPAE
jgi:hypothetical protein